LPRSTHIRSRPGVPPSSRGDRPRVDQLDGYSSIRSLPPPSYLRAGLVAGRPEAQQCPSTQRPESDQVDRRMKRSWRKLGSSCSVPVWPMMPIRRSHHGLLLTCELDGNGSNRCWPEMEASTGSSPDSADLHTGNTLLHTQSSAGVSPPGVGVLCRSCSCDPSWRLGLCSCVLGASSGLRQRV
jgi:hypothetical protein